MRMIGHGLGPGLTIVATRKSVIRSAEGLELVLTPLGWASSGSPSRSAAPKAPAELFRISRRLIEVLSDLLMGRSSFLTQVASRLVCAQRRFNSFSTWYRWRTGVPPVQSGGDARPPSSS